MAVPETPHRVMLGEPIELVPALRRWLAARPPLDGSVPDAPANAVSNTAWHDVSPHPDGAQRARHFAVATLRNWDLLPLSDTVELVVSELVTNALSHGLADRGPISGQLDVRCPVEFLLLCESPHVMCAVTDPSDDLPIRRDREDLADTGRGLQVVSACSRSWGWSRFAGGGKAVWALFHCPVPDDSARDDAAGVPAPGHLFRASLTPQPR